MSNGAITVPAAFQEKLRDALFEKFMELFPKEVLDKAIQDEITAFFESEIGPFTKTTVRVDNPNYRNSWDSRTLEIPAVTSALKITPFRQLVWESLHEHLKSVVDEIIKDRESAYGQAFAEYIGQVIKPSTESTLNANLHTLGAAMSGTLLLDAMNASVNASHASLQNSLRILNLPMDTVNGVPKFDPVLVYGPAS